MPQIVAISPKIRCSIGANRTIWALSTPHLYTKGTLFMSNPPTIDITGTQRQAWERFSSLPPEEQTLSLCASTLLLEVPITSITAHWNPTGVKFRLEHGPSTRSVEVHFPQDARNKPVPMSNLYQSLISALAHEVIRSAGVGLMVASDWVAGVESQYAEVCRQMEPNQATETLSDTSPEPAAIVDDMFIDPTPDRAE